MTPAEWITHRVAAVPAIRRVPNAAEDGWEVVLVLGTARTDREAYARCVALQRELAECREDAVHYDGKQPNLALFNTSINDWLETNGTTTIGTTWGRGQNLRFIATMDFNALKCAIYQLIQEAGGCPYTEADSDG